MNRNSVLLVVSLLALFSAYFYMNYRMSQGETAQQNSAQSVATSNPANAVIEQPLPKTAAVSVADVPQADAPLAAAAPTAANSPTLAIEPTTQSSAATAPSLVPPAESDDLSLKVSAAQVRFSRLGGCLGGVQLSNYKQELSKPDAALLFENYSLCKAFGFKWGEKDLRGAPISFERINEKSVRISQRVDNIDIVRTWNFDFKDYMSELKIEVKNYGATTVQSNLALELGATSEHTKAGGMFSGHAIEYRQFLYADTDKVHRTHLTFEGTPKTEELVNLARISPTWFGTDSIYFLTALLPQHREALDLKVNRTGFNIQRTASSEDVRTVYEAWASLPVEIAAASSKTYAYKVYMGPKQRALLKTVGDVNLHEAIDFGFFRVVALPMYLAMDWLFRMLGNWGLAIIALTLGIKLLFYPLMVKAFISGKKMQKMQPLMAEVREKYKDDKQKQQQETMALMSSHGVNPVSGCLPILPQIPVFFGLNSVLTHTFELRHAPFYGWIRDLSYHDPYYASPVLMALLMFVQQKMTPMPAMEPAQQKMMQFMPLLFAGFMLTYPSGLVVYIITNSLVSLIQQQYMMKKYKDL